MTDRDRQLERLRAERDTQVEMLRAERDIQARTAVHQGQRATYYYALYHTAVPDGQRAPTFSHIAQQSEGAIPPPAAPFMPPPPPPPNQGEGVGQS